jgi:plastocyanin
MTTRKGLIALAVTMLAFALAACGSSDKPVSSGSKPAAPNTVTTKLLSFKPETLTVKAGTKVTWTAGDGIGHTVTTGTFTVGSDDLRSEENPDGTIDMPLKKGEDVSYTFTKPGTYTYYCSIHKGMNGEVVVTE